jgi:hypothetical protein
MADGQVITTIDSVTTVDEFLGNKDRGIGLEGPFRITAANAAAQLSALFPLEVGSVKGLASTPPASPADGDSYIVGASPTGAFAAYVNYHAKYKSSAWVFTAPTAKMMFVFESDHQPRVWNGAAWVLISQGRLTYALEASMLANTTAAANVSAEVVADVVATTTHRARTSNVATLTTASAHGLGVGAVVNVRGLGGTGYNGRVTTLAGTTGSTIVYASTGANEGSTADTGGQVDRNGVFISNGAGAWTFAEDLGFDAIEARMSALETSFTEFETSISESVATAGSGATEALASYIDTPTTYGTAASNTGVSTPVAKVTFETAAAPRSAKLKKVKTWVISIGNGTGRMMVARPRPNGNYDIIHNVALTGIAATGALTLEAGTHFPEGMIIPVGAMIGVGSASGGVGFAAVVSAATYVSETTGGVNAVVTASAYKAVFEAIIDDTSEVATDLAPASSNADASALSIADNGVVETGVGLVANAGASDLGAGQDTLVSSPGEAFPYAGWLTGVICSPVVAGDIDFEIWTGSGAFVDSWRSTLVVGSNLVYSPPAPIRVEAGWLLFRRPAGGRIAGYVRSLPLSKYFNLNYTYEGATIATTTSCPAMRPIIRRQKTTREVIADQMRGRTLLGYEPFSGTSTGANWTLSGFTWNNGLHASGAGGYTTTAIYGKYSNAQRKTTIAKFQLNDATSKFGICFVPQDTSQFNHGTVALLDASAGASAAVLKLSGWNGGASVAATQTSGVIPFTIVTGRDYILQLDKINLKNVLTLIDTVTGSKFEFSHARMQHTVDIVTGYSDTGRQWGKAGLVHLSGDVLVKEFYRYTNVRQNPYWLWFGDSNSEGGLELGDAYDLAYVNRIEALRGKGDTLSMSRGGASGDEVIPCLDLDLDPFSPTYAVWNMGTNPDNADAGLGNVTPSPSWRTSTQTFITRALARGATPVLLCPAAYTANSTRILGMRSDIMSGYFGRYPYIDLTMATSAALDGVAMNTAYGDGLHFNFTGHQKIFEVIRDTAPYLL